MDKLQTYCYKKQQDILDFAGKGLPLFCCLNKVKIKLFII